MPKVIGDVTYLNDNYKYIKISGASKLNVTANSISIQFIKYLFSQNHVNGTRGTL